MMPANALKPDASVIQEHLAHITRRWHELDQPVMLEMVCLSADDRAVVKDVARFSPDQMGLEMAAEHAAAMNAHKINTYAVVNPVDASRQLQPGKRASKPDIVASFYHWADADNAQMAENIRTFVGPKCTFHVLTGTQPCMRPHVYWELEEPTRNLDAWEATQRAIAATLKTDGAVTDAPRIMRLAGTINWPKPSKAAKGYAAELTTLKIYDPGDRPPVSSERMARAFTPAAAPVGALHIDTGGTGGKTAADYADILARARTDGQKHSGVRDLAASLAGSGVSRTMAEAIIREACPVWDANVENLISTAYAKFYQPNEAPRELTPEERAAVPAAMFKPWVRKDLSAIPYPEFLYSDFYARGYTSLTLAAPKVGKSMLGLAEALDMSTGRGFLTGQPREPLRVVYFNAEDDQNVLDARVAALLTEYGISQDEIDGRFWPVSGVEMDGFYLINGPDGIVNEQLFVSLEKFCAEQRADVLIFDPLQDLSTSPETNEVFRLLGQRLRKMAAAARISLGIIHHTRKVAPGMTATIDDGRGGSALRGTSRFNRILNAMTEDEAAKAGVENHRYFFRIGDMESNLAPPSSDVNRWFEKRSILTPNGQYIGAIAPWKWPDAFDGVTVQKAAQVRLAVDHMAEPPRHDIRSPEWVGLIVADVLGMDPGRPADKARIKAMLSEWVKTDVLRVTEVENARAGRTQKVVIAGANNPAIAGGQDA